MKNIVIPVLAGISIFITSNLNAQVRFIPTGGVNFSAMTLQLPDAEIHPKLLTAYHFGALVEIPVWQGFLLQPVVLYSVKGSEYSIIYKESDYDFTMAPAYAVFQLYGVYRLSLGNARLLFRAGPYAAYAVGGEFTDKSNERDLSFGEGEDCDMKALDYGVGVSLGIDINNFLISGQYEIGVPNLAPVNGSEMKIRVLGFSVGYFFGTK